MVLFVDILDIPDLDEEVEVEEEDDIQVQIANAPRFADTTLPSLEKLDSEIKYAVSTAIVRKPHPRSLDLRFLS